MNLLQRLFAGAGLAAVALAPLSAIAQSAGSFSAVHKWTDAATSKTYVYVPGQTAAAPVAGFSAPKAPAPKTLTLNNCGWGSFTKSATSPPTNITGGSTNWAGKTSGAAVTCSAGASSSTYTASNTGPVGTVVDDGSKIWIKGGTGPGSLAIEVTASGVITTKANACGFVRVTVGTSRPMTNFSIGATEYTLAAIPSVPAPMICRKVGTTSATYVPAN
ncbi:MULTISPECIES: hypothetical protein [unclassified Microcoleus]|uniref:hypothetical protein n=1 Tax=unclassified Microcoleus TaxID=2642155 RepID=UPI002FD7014F